MKKKLFFKKGLLLSLLMVLTILSFTSTVWAFNFKEETGISQIATGAGYGEAKDPGVYIGEILLLVFSFVGIIFMMLVIYAGIQWMTAQGNTSQVSKAKDTLIKAVVGLVIIMSAYGITYFVVNTFQSPSRPELPSE